MYCKRFIRLATIASILSLTACATPGGFQQSANDGSFAYAMQSLANQYNRPLQDHSAPAAPMRPTIQQYSPAPQQPVNPYDAMYNMLNPQGAGF